MREPQKLRPDSQSKLRISLFQERALISNQVPFKGCGFGFNFRNEHVYDIVLVLGRENPLF
jgi:hypothetical protein